MRDLVSFLSLHDNLNRKGTKVTNQFPLQKSINDKKRKANHSCDKNLFIFGSEGQVSPINSKRKPSRSFLRWSCPHVCPFHTSLTSYLVYFCFIRHQGSDYQRLQSVLVDIQPVFAHVSHHYDLNNDYNILNI